MWALRCSSRSTACGSPNLSEKNIEDVRVRELADGISEAQRMEIKEMTWLIEDIRANGVATTPEEADARPVPDFATAAK